MRLLTGFVVALLAAFTLSGCATSSHVQVSFDRVVTVLQNTEDSAGTTNHEFTWHQPRRIPWKRVAREYDMTADHPHAEAELLSESFHAGGEGLTTLSATVKVKHSNAGITKIAVTAKHLNAFLWFDARNRDLERKMLKGLYSDALYRTGRGQ